MTSLRSSALQAEDVLLDLIHNALDIGHGNGALGAGQTDALQQLVPVERLAATIALDDQQRLGDLLVGGKTFAAGLAFATPADAVAGRAGIYDARLGTSTIWTLHSVNLSRVMDYNM